VYSREVRIPERLAYLGGWVYLVGWDSQKAGILGRSWDTDTLEVRYLGGRVFGTLGCL
jgi:hypothetical protein